MSQSSWSINAAAYYLKDFNALLLTGKVKIKNRPDVVNSFNNDPNSIVLVMNPDVGGFGLSMHDTIGEYHQVTS